MSIKFDEQAENEKLLRIITKCRIHKISNELKNWRIINNADNAHWELLKNWRV